MHKQKKKKKSKRENMFQCYATKFEPLVYGELKNIFDNKSTTYVGKDCSYAVQTVCSNTESVTTVFT